jgi:molybdopterin-guanine dinucleotide biosynthesis protein A
MPISFTFRILPEASLFSILGQIATVSHGIAEAMEIIGAIIAGGAGRRLAGRKAGGRSKPFLDLAGAPLIAHVTKRFVHQVDHLVISAAASNEGFSALGLSLVDDLREGNRGPLAGIEAVLVWMKERIPNAEWLALAPCDVPFLPEDLVTRLVAGAEQADASAAVAEREGRLHPLCAVIRPAALSSLQDWLDKDRRAVHRWTEELGAAAITFDDIAGEPFFNINTPADLERARALIADEAPGTLVQQRD